MIYTPPINHVKKNTSSSSINIVVKNFVSSEREREREYKARQTDRRGGGRGLVLIVVPLLERRPFEIIIVIVSELFFGTRDVVVLFNPFAWWSLFTLVFVICVGIIEKKRKREKTTTKKTLDARKTRKRNSTSGPQMSNQAVILLRNQLRGERNGGYVCFQSLVFSCATTTTATYTGRNDEEEEENHHLCSFLLRRRSRTGGVSFFLFAKKPRADDAVLFSTIA